MTDELGSRLAASQMKLRAEGLVVGKLAELGFSNPRVEKAYDFAQGGWDNEKAYAAMTMRELSKCIMKYLRANSKIQF